MSWISDVKYELGKLDLSIKSLRKFAFTIGLILLIIYSWFYYKDFSGITSILILITCLLLLLLGIFFPKSLNPIYKLWMGLAFVLGWFVSRIILSLLFIFILTPISLIAKLVNKKFLDLSFKNQKDSYWIRKNNEQINYEKMY